MMKHRNTEKETRQTPQASQARILEAAKESILAVGVRRTKFTDVARIAGVSRMTVYRHFPDTTSLVGALMTHEFGAQLQEVLARAAKQRTGRARLVFAVVGGVEALAEHPLFRRVLDVDPELLLPYLVQRLGSTQKEALSLLRQLLKEGQADRSIRRGNDQLIAHALLFSVQSFLVGGRVATPGIARTALIAELETLVDRYLAP